MQVDAPETVYQTVYDGAGRQDSSSLLRLSIQLSAAMARALRAATSGPCATPLSRVVHGAIRRFDGAELGVYDEAHEAMVGLRLPPAVFAFSLASAGAGAGAGAGATSSDVLDVAVR